MKAGQTIPETFVGNPFTHHPAEVGETYGGHFLAATRFGALLVGAGLACLFHAILPFVFPRTGSDVVRRLHFEMMSRRENPGGVARRS